MVGNSFSQSFFNLGHRVSYLFEHSMRQEQYMNKSFHIVCAYFLLLVSCFFAGTHACMHARTARVQLFQTPCY